MMNAHPIDLQKIAYSIKEACLVSSLGRTTLYSHIAAGRLRAVRVGGRTVIPAEDLRALVEGEGAGCPTTQRGFRGARTLKSTQPFRDADDST